MRKIILIISSKKLNSVVNKSVSCFFYFLSVVFFSYLFIAETTNNGINAFSQNSKVRIYGGHSIRDNSSYQLKQASSVSSAIIDGNTYIFVTGYDDDGISVFDVERSYNLDYIMSVRDNDVSNLDGAIASTTAMVSGTTYLFVAGYFDNGVSVFKVSKDGNLTHVASVGDNATYELKGASSVITAEINKKTYLFVAGRLDDGVSVFNVGGDGSLTHVASVDDKSNPQYRLGGAVSVATGVAYGDTYLFVAGSAEDGVTVFKVGNDGGLTYAAKIDDKDDGGNETYKLDEAYSIVSAEISNSTYIFVAGRLDNGITVFRVGKGGRLSQLHSVSDKSNPKYELKEAYALAITKIGNINYLFVAGYFDDGISVFRVGFTGKLHYITSVDDKDGNFALDGASSIALSEVVLHRDTYYPDLKYVFVTGFYEDGINAFYFQVKEN